MCGISMRKFWNKHVYSMYEELKGWLDPKFVQDDKRVSSLITHKDFITLVFTVASLNQQAVCTGSYFS